MKKLFLLLLAMMLITSCVNQETQLDNAQISQEKKKLVEYCHDDYATIYVTSTGQYIHHGNFDGGHAGDSFMDDWEALAYCQTYGQSKTNIVYYGNNFIILDDLNLNKVFLVSKNKKQEVTSLVSNKLIDWPDFSLWEFNFGAECSSLRIYYEEGYNGCCTYTWCTDEAYNSIHCD